MPMTDADNVLSKMTEWIKTNIIDRMSYADSISLIGANASTTVNIYVAVMTNDKPVFDLNKSGKADKISGNKIINYTRNGKRRIEIAVSASYDAPTDTVRRACLEALERSASILDNPKPFVRLLSYDSSDIRYGLYFWVKPEDYVNVKFAINELIREKFNEKGIEMTYSHLNVHLLDQKE